MASGGTTQGVKQPRKDWPAVIRASRISRPVSAFRGVTKAPSRSSAACWNSASRGVAHSCCMTDAGLPARTRGFTQARNWCQGQTWISPA